MLLTGCALGLECVVPCMLEVLALSMASQRDPPGALVACMVGVLPLPIAAKRARYHISRGMVRERTVRAAADTWSLRQVSTESCFVPCPPADG